MPKNWIMLVKDLPANMHAIYRIVQNISTAKMEIQHQAIVTMVKCLALKSSYALAAISQPTCAFHVQKENIH